MNSELSAVLELRSDCLENTTRGDLAAIGAVMLWPKNEEKQQASLHAFLAESPEEVMQGPVAKEDLRAFAAMIRAAPSMEAVTQESARAFEFGSIAGTILYHSVGMLAIDPAAAPASALKAQIAKKWARRRISEKTINQTIWPTYRCVSALWAAHIWWRQKTACTTVFPCLPGDLGEFLAVAEEFRTRGESLKVPGSPEPTILRKSETIRVPPNLILPHIDLAFE
jgi:hypothetical protein